MRDDVRVRVLIVEDNPADVHLIREALTERSIDFELDVIEDGEEAYHFFGNNERGACADVVLMDLNLPKISGDAILSRMRSNPQFANVPAIVLTSSDSPKDRQEAERLGASAYVRKPSNLDEFFAIADLIGELTGRPSQPLP